MIEQWAVEKSELLAIAENQGICHYEEKVVLLTEHAAAIEAKDAEIERLNTCAKGLTQNINEKDRRIAELEEVLRLRDTEDQQIERMAENSNLRAELATANRRATLAERQSTDNACLYADAAEELATAKERMACLEHDVRAAQQKVESTRGRLVKIEGYSDELYKAAKHDWVHAMRNGERLRVAIAEYKALRGERLKEEVI